MDRLCFNKNNQKDIGNIMTLCKHTSLIIFQIQIFSFPKKKMPHQSISAGVCNPSINCLSYIHKKHRSTLTTCCKCINFLTCRSNQLPDRSKILATNQFSHYLPGLKYLQSISYLPGRKSSQSTSYRYVPARLDINHLGTLRV